MSAPSPLRPLPEESGPGAPGPLLARIASPGVLYRCWEDARDADLAAGGLSEAAAKFALNPGRELDTLARSLLDGSYRPKALARVVIPKSRGGSRSLAVPPFRDRIAERAIVGVLEPLLDPEFGPWSFAYRPGLGTEDAVGAVVEEREGGASWVALTDFQDCFDSLDRARLLGALQARVPDQDLLELIGRFLSRPVRVYGVVRPTSRGAPQGSPLSPLLCNLYLSDFDLLLWAGGLRPVRYADDVAIPARSQREAEQALDSARGAARMVGLTLRPDKSRAAPFSQGFTYLGRAVDAVHPRPRPQELARSLTRGLYVQEQGAGVALKDGQVRVVKGGETLLAVPSSHLSQIVLFGAVGLSAGARAWALQSNVDVSFLSRRGAYLGRLDGPRPANTRLRRRQYAVADDDQGALRVASAIVAGKIANARALLLRHARTGSPELASIAGDLLQARRSALVAGSVPALLGIEGAASRLHFQGLRALVPPGLGFEGRRRRPATDPVNSALSFGYTLLMQEAVSAVASIGLDPHVGFLHQPHQGRPSLALDLMEEFRALVVDSVVVEAFRRRSLGPADFRVEPEGGGCLLKDGPRKAFLRAYEQRMATLFSYIPTRTRISYRRALFVQARQLAAVILGHADAYRPVAWR